MKKRQGRVLVGRLPPRVLDKAVSQAFGQPLGALEHRLLIKNGKRIASGFCKTR